MPFFPTGWDLPDICVKSMFLKEFLKSKWRLLSEIKYFILLTSIAPIISYARKSAHCKSKVKISKRHTDQGHLIILNLHIEIKLAERKLERIHEGILLLPVYFCCGQKWHCVEEITGKWRIQKCKGGLKEGSRKRARSLRPSSTYDNRERGCDCGDALLRPSRTDRRSHRQLSGSSGQREYLWTSFFLTCNIVLMSLNTI